MFATLGGSLPAPVIGSPDGETTVAVDDAVAIVIADQEAAGLELVTDGGRRHPDPSAALLGGLAGIRLQVGKAARVRSLPEWRAPVFVEGWTASADRTDRPVKQPIVGPYTLGRAIEPGRFGRAAVTLALAEAINAELRALIAAGCPVVEVVEDAAVAIGDAPAERRLFVDAHRRLLAGIGEPGSDDGAHRTLAIRGGNADAADAATFVDAPYHSYLFDLCAGPDNWRLVTKVPGDRGVIVGAADARSGRVDELEILAFAIGYAASTGGRGHARVGLATSGDLLTLPYKTAMAKVRRIGEAAAYYEAEPSALARAIDPRAHDIRSAAMGRLAPGDRPPRGRP